MTHHNGLTETQIERIFALAGTVSKSDLLLISPRKYLSLRRAEAAHRAQIEAYAAGFNRRKVKRLARKAAQAVEI